MKKLVVLILALAMTVTLMSGFAMPVQAAAYNGIPVATGSGIDVLPTPGGPFFNIMDYGADPSANGVVNQTAINQAIASASAAGGGTVLVPAGDFKTYTIRMQSNVTLWLSDPTTVLRAARVSYDGGYYDAPEPFLWVGLQDQGHSDYARNPVNALVAQGIIGGKPGNLFDPKGTATRAEVAALMHRYMAAAQ